MGCLSSPDNKYRNFHGKRYERVEGCTITPKDAEIVERMYRDTHSVQTVKSRSGVGYAVYIRKKPAHVKLECPVCGSHVKKITPSLGQCTSCAFLTRIQR